METDQKILKAFIRVDADEVINQIEDSGIKETSGLLESLPPEQVSILLSRMNRIKAARIIDHMETSRSARFLEQISPGVVVIILRQLDGSKRKSILNKLPESLSQTLELMLQYPDDTVGAYIDPKVFTLYEDLGNGAALEMIKLEHRLVGTILFVLSREHKLTGYVELTKLIAENPEKKISSLMNMEVPRVPAGMDIDVLFDGRLWHPSFSQMPVVDTRDLFLGVISRESLEVIDRKKSTVTRQARQASMALGDLFQIGLTGIFRSASDIIWVDKSKNKED